MKLHWLMRTISLALVTLSQTPTFAYNRDFIIFSDRPSFHFQKPIYELQNYTGTVVHYVEEETEELIQRLEKGETADAILVKDLFYVAKLIKKNLIQEGFFPASLIQQAPVSLQDSKARWLSITYRARSLAYSTQLSSTELAQLETYSDLLNPAWQGSLCLRQAKHPYNQTLGAQWIAELGFSQALDLVKGLVAQAVAPTYASDKAILSAIAKGECLLGLVNHYYVIQMLRDQPHLPIGFKYLKDATGGTPLNGVSLLLPKTSKNTKSIHDFMRMLIDAVNNPEIAKINGDFPISWAYPKGHIPTSWGELQPSKISWESVLNHYDQVKLLFESAGYE
jgi:iron(III) transport system substrate-binding protein